MEFTNTTLLYGLFNQYVFSEAKMNLEHLKRYYKYKNVHGNSLITKLLGLIENYQITELTESRFLLTLQQDGKSLDESNVIYKKIHEYQSYTREQSSVFVENLRDVCYYGYHTFIQTKYSNDIRKYVEALKEFKYHSNYSNILIAKNFRELDITDLVDRYSAEGYKSRYDFINKAFTCGGYIPGQVVMVVGAPSTGKSLFLQSEAVNFIQQGKRVHMLTLGDLNELDLAIRMMCQISNKSQRQIESDIIGNFQRYQDLFKDYLSTTVVPSGKVTAREYVDWMLQRADEYDVLMIDYDSNFLTTAESMYSQGGETYDAFTELTRLGKLVFVASQPKQSYFHEEFLPQDSVGESSRKVHISDVIITIGRRSEAGMPMGIMNIAKNRRGLNTYSYWIRTNDGLFYNPSEALYLKYRNNKSQTSLFSYNELNAMDIIDSAVSEQFKETLEDDKNE